MFSRFVLLSSLVVFSLGATGELMASWAAVPLEILADEADVIVEGKVVEIADAGFNVGTRPYDVAVVEITTVLKNLSGKQIKQVRVAQPAKSMIGLSTDIRYQVGQSGIWMLVADSDAKRNAYWASHPSQYQAVAKKDELTKLLKSRETLAGGKPSTGLVARAEVIRQETPPRPGVDNPPQFIEVRFSLKNVSKEPITICDFVGDKPLVVRWIGPDGERRESQHYTYLQRVRLAGVAERNFIVIPPGGVQFLGPNGKYYGISFTTAERQETNIVEAGKHRVLVGYQNKQDGTDIEAKNVWLDRVAANEVEFTVK